MAAGSPAGNGAGVAKLQGRPASVGDFTHQGQFEVLKDLHQSSCGSVCLARVKDHRLRAGTPQHVILKRRKVAELGKAKDMLNEYEVLKRLSHPNIIRCYGYFWESQTQSLFIVLEYAARGDLHAELKARRDLGQHFSDREVWDIFAQVLLGLAYMHSKGIVHRDIKCLNLLLTDNGVVKLGDFGVSRLMSDQTMYLNSFYGTPLYLSPEIVEGRPYSQTTDVWSLGVVLYEISALQPPFNGSSLQDVVSAVLRGKFSPLPRFRSVEFGALVQEMLTREPHRRPTTAELVQRLERLGHLRRGSLTSASGGSGGSRGREATPAEVRPAGQNSPSAAVVDSSVATILQHDIEADDRQPRDGRSLQEPDRPSPARHCPQRQAPRQQEQEHQAPLQRWQVPDSPIVGRRAEDIVENGGARGVSDAENDARRALQGVLSAALDGPAKNDPAAARPAGLRVGARVDRFVGEAPASQGLQYVSVKRRGSGPSASGGLGGPTAATAPVGGASTVAAPSRRSQSSPATQAVPPAGVVGKRVPSAGAPLPVCESPCRRPPPQPPPLLGDRQRSATCASPPQAGETKLGGLPIGASAAARRRENLADAGAQMEVAQDVAPVSSPACAPAPVPVTVPARSIWSPQKSRADHSEDAAEANRGCNNSIADASGNRSEAGSGSSARSLRDQRWEERRRAHLNGGGQVFRVSRREAAAPAHVGGYPTAVAAAPVVQPQHNQPSRRSGGIGSLGARGRAASEGPVVARPPPWVAAGQTAHATPQQPEAPGRPPTAPSRPARYDIIANRWVDG